MIRKIENLVLLTFIAVLLLVVQSSTSSPIQNDDILEELKAELKSLRVKIDLLEARNVENEATILKQGVKILKLEEKMDAKLGSAASFSSDERAVLHPTNNNKMNQDKSSLDDETMEILSSSTRAFSAPSSCRDLSLLGHSLDGLYLVQNVDTNKIETVLCNFGTSPSQQLIGNVDVKKKTVHFYVQRNTPFNLVKVIPWQVERLNEGGAMNLASGIFTVPVDGIYHFEFSCLKDTSAPYVFVILQVNGQDIGSVGSNNGPNSQTYESYSLTASLRLKAGDTVRLFNILSSKLFDNGTYKTHFTGWLVEEDLSTVV